jgi:Tfp pilus assembly protein PilF
MLDARTCRRAALALAALVSACASAPPAEPAASENQAVVALVDDARPDPAGERRGESAAAIERALRIEPRNPRLWQRLARLRLDEGDYAQAESLAARANSWSGKDRRLRAANWRIIAEARSRRGDPAGAKAAAARAEGYER